MDLIIREEVPADYPGVTAVNDGAFDQPDEGRLVAALRAHPDFSQAVSLVAENQAGVVGHVLFFPIHIRTQSGVVPTLGLVPISVLPEFQKQGIGSRLVNAGLALCRNRGHRSVIVLGHKTFFPKFGFAPAAQWGIDCPFPGAEEAFMAIELVPGALAQAKGLVEYPSEFNGF